MGTEPPAEKKEPPAASEQRETQSDDRGSKSKGYRGNNRRYGKPKSTHRETVTNKSKFKGAIEALQDYYFDTGPTQAHDFKKTHKKISTYTGTKYSAEVMMSIENMEYYNWASSMPRKPIKSDFDTSTGGISNIATVIPQEYLDRYEYKINRIPVMAPISAPIWGVHFFRGHISLKNWPICPLSSHDSSYFKNMCLLI
jgi:hypothetical protein